MEEEEQKTLLKQASSENLLKENNLWLSAEELDKEAQLKSKLLTLSPQER